MSSTNRGGYRMADDFYATPTWAVDAVLRRLLMPGLRILEPSAGRGAIVRALLAHGADPALITAVEPHEGRAEVLRGLGVTVANDTFENFAARSHGAFDLIMLAWTTDDDLLAMATDDDRAEAYKRAEKKRAKPMTPEQRLVSVVRARLSQTDSCAYAWGIFGHGCGGRFWTHEEAA